MGKLLNPFKWGELRASIKEMGKRMESKDIDGNLKGEGIVQGGVIVVGPSPACKVTYTYLEETGSELPLSDIEAAVLQLTEQTKAVERA
mmetsp:Transcript_74322/g.124034  ORF Transcript_74322/g.124034 Transcript_74322/m.124034 type:complete len:89 (+) Transcript_74322:432-698(+)